MLKIVFYLLFFIQVSPCEKSESWALPKDYQLILKKAKNGDKEAQETISHIIYKGIIRYPKEDNPSEKNLYFWLAEKSHHDSYERKVVRFFYFWGNVSDADLIYQEIQEKAKSGSIDAERSLGSCYFHTRTVGSEDMQKALSHYENAAKNGHARAMQSMSLRYLRGSHVPLDKEKGLKYLFSAAEKELPEAVCE